jgi:hypothetical protein
MTVTKTTACPFCGHVSNRAAGIDTSSPAAMKAGIQPIEPGPGDLALCIGCGEFAYYDDGMDLRKPTDDEYMEIGEDPGCRTIRAAWMTAQRERHEAEEDSA